MTDETKRMTALDRWVLTSVTLNALALIVASVVTGEQIYLAALGSVGALIVIYFIFPMIRLPHGAACTASWSLLVRNGACNKCINSGATSGCC